MFIDILSLWDYDFHMPNIKQGVSSVKLLDKGFSGTVAFKSDKISLPDGSKVAVGIDNERWVILYQKTADSHLVIYEYNAEKRTLLVDKKKGSDEEHKMLSKIVNYFFKNADVDDVVTIEIGGNI